MISLLIKGNPAPKKNSQEIHYRGRGAARKPFIAQGSRYTDYEASAVFQTRVQYRDEPIDYPVNVRCLYYRQTKIRVDLTNLLEATDDILVKAGVLADDCYKYVAGHDGSRVRFDKDNPRVEIVIEPLDDDWEA